MELDYLLKELFEDTRNFIALGLHVLKSHDIFDCIRDQVNFRLLPQSLIEAVIMSLLIQSASIYYFVEH